MFLPFCSEDRSEARLLALTGIFQIFIDWNMRKTTSDSKWIFTMQLEDCDFAGDITVVPEAKACTDQVHSALGISSEDLFDNQHRKEKEVMWINNKQ